MFEDQPKIVSSEINPSAKSGDFLNETPKSPKKIILIGGLIIVILVILGGGFLFFKKQIAKKSTPLSPVATSTPATSTIPNLPGLDELVNGLASSTSATSSLTDLAIERLAFVDFYKTPDNQFDAQFVDYQLPQNIKIEVMNYYDVSRKVPLDLAIDDLNNQGLALVDNPWPKSTDFYSVYNNLNEQQVPLLITSDFMIYYYQSVLKKVFKDIEENIFYENLWNISKELYTQAKDRYEARLAAIGNINDSILEGERLAAAYFAVALELLKPAPSQIAAQGALDDKKKFTSFDADRYYFITPPYLKTDVLREVELIRAAKEKVKSPVLLYTRDYQTFTVATDYKANAKLNNFYLVTKWLNSVFPIEPRSDGCPDCLLDQEDGRINLIAASFISTDFYNSSELKGKWARIYKVMSFFKGLREDLIYLHYRDSLASLFGEDYKIEELFTDSNQEAADNLDKLRQALLVFDFPEIQGAWNKESETTRPNLGLKILADSYWPNNYLFENLVGAAVGDYQGSGPELNNITNCQGKGFLQRCTGFALDVINLIQPISDSAYFLENTNYADYSSAVDRLRGQLEDNAVWRSTNYWTTLSIIQTLLNTSQQSLPIFASSPRWQERAIDSSVSAWINFQLPLEPLTVRQDPQGTSLNNLATWGDNSYVEPNFSLVNELLANNEMLLKMFTALRLNDEVGSVAQNLQDLGENLGFLKDIISKELSGTILSAEDNEAIIRFARQFKATPTIAKDKQLILTAGLRQGPKEDLSKLKLLVLVHQEGDNKIIAVGPVWSYTESRFTK